MSEMIKILPIVGAALLFLKYPRDVKRSTKLIAIAILTVLFVIFWSQYSQCYDLFMAW
jgi:dipeptide/tripeptide permease